MLLQRRNFRHLYDNQRDDVISGHLFSDGSPVTGSEIQGMVLQLAMADLTFITVILPGVCLHYGAKSVLDKALAFMHAIYLILGPDGELMKWFVGKIKTITTDMGTEIRILDTPDIIYAYLQRLKGIPMESLVGAVDATSRLFCNAVRIPGWSHTFGNLMEAACKYVDRWPELLDSMRTLARFFRYKPWRQHVRAKLRDQYPEVHALLKSFTANLTKWRYESVFVLMFQLLPLRFLCETYLIHVDVMFSDFQDGALLAGVKSACIFRICGFP